MTPNPQAQALLTRFQKADIFAPDCPSRALLQHMTSRWGALVMVVLATGTHRFSTLRRAVGGVSERMLAQTLQLLEADGLVNRTAHAVVPPHVDYSLTAEGEAAARHLVALAALLEDYVDRRSAKAVQTAAE